MKIPYIEFVKEVIDIAPICMNSSTYLYIKIDQIILINLNYEKDK